MRARWRRRLAGDDGLSLVEVLVAFVLLGVVMSASAGFFTTSLRALQQAEGRTKATALANEELENLRGLPWSAVGFYGDDDFSGAMPDRTVLLADARPADSRAPLPVETVSRAGVDFTVRRSIVWNEDIPTTSEVHEFKYLAVTVDWSDRGQPRSIGVESQRTPTPDEQKPSDFVLSLLKVQPELVYINDDGTLVGQLDLTALTSAPADFVVARYVQRGDTEETVRSLGSTDYVNWTGAVTPAHGDTFRNGDMVFTFVATRASPYEQEVIGTTLARFLQPVVVTDLQLSPSSVCVAPDESTPAVDVAVHVNGLVDEDAVTVSWDGGTTQAQQVAATDAGSSLSAIIPTGSYTDTTAVTVTGVRASDGHTATASATLQVNESC